MGWKDWLAGGAFALTVALALTAFILVFHHEQSHHPAKLTPGQQVNLRNCYENLGNGGC